jgi:flagellar biogenesis protein FliO
MIGAFAVIGAVLFALQFVARAGGRQRITMPGRRLVTVLETTYLPQQASLHVVRIGDAYAVVARSGNHVAKIDDIPAETVERWLESRTEPLDAQRLRSLVARFRRGAGTTSPPAT